MRVHGVFLLTNSLPACSCCCAAGRRDERSPRRRDGFDGRLRRWRRLQVRALPLCCLPHHRFTRAFLLRCCRIARRALPTTCRRALRRAPALGGAAGTGLLLLSLFVWLYAHLPTYFLAQPSCCCRNACRALLARRWWWCRYVLCFAIPSPFGQHVCVDGVVAHVPHLHCSCFLCVRAGAAGCCPVGYMVAAVQVRAFSRAVPTCCARAVCVCVCI